MNTKTKAIIVDDEIRSRSIIQNMLLKCCPQIVVCGEAGTVEEAVALINTQEPQIVFLDITLGLGTGFDILAEVSYSSFKTIFITAYDSFAINAIKWSAVDYLLKPLNPNDLKLAVQRCIDMLNAPIDSSNYSKNNLGIPTMDGLKLVEITDIIRCEARNTYTEFHFQNQEKIVSSKPLHHYEEILNNYNFLRVHKSHLINLSHIKEYIKGRGGNVIMKDNTVINVAALRKDILLKHIPH